MSLYEIKGLTFAYPDIISERDDIYLDPCLNDINITIEQGEFVVVAGGSGSGKTTLLRQLKPVLTPRGKREGAITFAGQEFSQMDEKMQTQKIGFVMQDVDAQLVTDKVWHELAFGLESLGLPTEAIRKRVAEMCSFFGLNSIFHKKVNELSGGQKQLVNLASVLALSPDVVILDEPASQLDPMAARDFFRCLERINKELGITIIITEHRLEELWAMCDRFILLDHGMVLYDGTIQEGVHTLYETEPSIELPAACRIALGLQEKEQVPVTVTDGRSWLVRYDRNMNRLAK
jgi:energy-coupling factor transporter ATP-binding protein EcfA2